MRKILTFLIVALPFTVLAYTSPGKPTGFVNDFAGILDASTKQTLEAKLGALDQATGAQVAVVTVGSLDGETVEGYSIRLAEEWGIGDKERDSGILILVAPNEREVRIEVGYGLEGPVTDLQAGLIIRNVMIPAFKQGDYDKGISESVDALSAVIMKSPEATAYLNAKGSGSSGSKIDPFAIFFLFIIIINIFARMLGKTKSWWLGGVLGAIVGAVIGIIFGFLYVGISAIIGLSILGLFFDYFVSKKGPGSGGHHGGFWFFGSGGHGGFGSSGGGFGGFGGGGFGGGGASGRW